MKQALIVDPFGAVEDFAQTALTLYEQTTVSTLQDALAHASGAEYGLILIAQPEGLCDDALWAMVERIVRVATDAALIMIMTQAPDTAYHRRAAELGITVLTAPLDVTAQALIDEVTAG